MGALSDYLENKIVDEILRGQAYTPPATVYVALFTTSPNDAGGGVEVSGGGYARVAVTADLNNWTSTQGTTVVASSGTDGTVENAVDIVFPAPTANWGSIVAFGIFDAATGGESFNLVCFDYP